MEENLWFVVHILGRMIFIENLLRWKGTQTPIWRRFPYIAITIRPQSK